MTGLSISVVVVSWRSEVSELEGLARALDREAIAEALLVDNSGDAVAPAPFETYRPGRNLGFAGGANFGAARARGEVVLLLNPDARPLPGALEALAPGFDRFPDALGLAPRLVGPEGTPQFPWQLRPLPRPWQLLAQALFLDLVRGPGREPPAGALVPQPAAAALALRRREFLELGGFDERFWPAWFEDVDLAVRAARAGKRFHYWPASAFEHRGAGSFEALGYERFLTCYAANLARYLELHHGRGWARTYRALAPVGALLRWLSLPVRPARRVGTSREARAALQGYLRASLGGFRRLPDLGR